MYLLEKKYIIIELIIKNKDLFFLYIQPPKMRKKKEFIKVKKQRKKPPQFFKFKF